MAEKSILSDLESLRIAPQFLKIEASEGISTVNSGGKRVYGPLDPNGYCVVRRTSPLTRERVTKFFRPDRLIRVFFEWDYLLNEYGRTEEVFRQYLASEWEAGIRNCAQFDFSVWFWEPEEKRLRNIYTNFRYLQIAHELGFRTILNFNNILLKYRTLYRTILPREVHTIIVDANHSERAHAREESLAMSATLEDFDVSTVIVISGRTVPGGLDHIIRPCKAAGVRVAVSPPEVFWMRFKNLEISRLDSPKVVQAGG